MQDLPCRISSDHADESMIGTAPKDGAVFVLIAFDREWPSEGVLSTETPTVIRETVAKWSTSIPKMKPLFARIADARETPPSVWVFRTTPHQRLSLRFDLNEIIDIHSIDLPNILTHAGDPKAVILNEPYYAVCTHGKRDACCALYGTRLAQALVPYAQGRVLKVSHIGGHRFAPIVVSLPDGLCYGRVRDEDAKLLIQSHKENKIYQLDCLRGRCGFDEPLQAAEVLYRMKNNVHEIDEVIPLYQTVGENHEAMVTLEVCGEKKVVRVRREQLTAQRMTSCGDVLTPTSRFRLCEEEESSPLGV